MSPKEDQAEKHRRTVYDQAGQHGRAALAKMDSTETPEQRTFSIRVRTIDGCKQASIVLSLDDNITEIRERIQDELELRQISTIWVVWSNFKPGIERSRLTERNLEETLRGLWRRSGHVSDALVVEFDEEPLMENRRPTSPDEKTKAEEPKETESL